MSKRYETGLEKVRRLIHGQKYDPKLHLRFLRVKIWHFDPVKARYLVAINPIIVVAAAFSQNLVSLLILDAVVCFILCILLGLSTHDDCATEGEALLQMALQVDSQKT